MTWGSGQWGSTPWGGGEPSVSGDVTINAIRFITPTYIRLELNTQVIVNDQYLDETNYVIGIRDDTPIVGADVQVVRVFAPAQDVLIADYVYLETTPFTDGATYDVSFNQLFTLDGTGSLSSSMPISARVTKTMSALKALPAHFDKRLDSLLHAVVSAISLQDDQLGGSRNDEFP